jgi:hypothetical protein
MGRVFALWLQESHKKCFAAELTSTGTSRRSQRGNANPTTSDMDAGPALASHCRPSRAFGTLHSRLGGPLHVDSWQDLPFKVAPRNDKNVPVSANAGD